MTDLERAVELNEAEFLLALGRAGGAEERCDDRIHWVIGGSPIAYHNCVLRADLEPDEADAEIAASRELMDAKGVSGSWHVGPSMRPADLAERLRAHGFEGDGEPGMAAQLDAIPDVDPVEGLDVERVTTNGRLDDYEHVLAQGFGEGPKEASWVRSMYDRIGFSDDAPWRHYVGHIEGRPVATATLFFAAGVAGIYFVSTVPTERGRGVGSAITRAAMIAARDNGFATAVLGSSPMGQRVYERLGFHTVCTVGVYEWTAD